MPAAETRPALASCGNLESSQTALPPADLSLFFLAPLRRVCARVTFPRAIERHRLVCAGGSGAAFAEGRPRWTNWSDRRYGAGRDHFHRTASAPVPDSFRTASTAWGR